MGQLNERQLQRTAEDLDYILQCLETADLETAEEWISATARMRTG